MHSGNGKMIPRSERGREGEVVRLGRGIAVRPASTWLAAQGVMSPDPWLRLLAMEG